MDVGRRLALRDLPARLHDGRGEHAAAADLVPLSAAHQVRDGERGEGEYEGEARGPNIIAASIEAYLVALNKLLGEEHWEGAPEAAAATGTRARRKEPVSAGTARERRAELDEEQGTIDTVDWFNQ